MFASEISYLESKPYFETAICQVSFSIILPQLVSLSSSPPTPFAVGIYACTVFVK